MAYRLSLVAPRQEGNDGTGCFRSPTGPVLVSNHEIGGEEPY
jgi:hypothetical protein